MAIEESLSILIRDIKDLSDFLYDPNTLQLNDPTNRHIDPHS